MNSFISIVLFVTFLCSVKSVNRRFYAVKLCGSGIIAFSVLLIVKIAIWGSKFQFNVQTFIITSKKVLLKFCDSCNGLALFYLPTPSTKEKQHIQNCTVLQFNCIIVQFFVTLLHDTKRNHKETFRD